MGRPSERIGAFLLGFGSVCVLVGVVATLTKSGHAPSEPVPTKKAESSRDHYAEKLPSDDDYYEAADDTSFEAISNVATEGLTDEESKLLMDHYAAIQYDMPTGTTPPGDANGYWSTGVHKTMKVYHQTSPEICASIMKDNFHIGKGGLCGKAIYFALSPEVTKTKAITGNSYGGCMIEAEVDVGKQGYYYWNGGRDNRFKESCGGWNALTGEKLHRKGYDSVVMRQGDGDEIIVFEPERILSKRILPFNCQWMCAGNCHKIWPPNCGRRSRR